MVRRKCACGNSAGDSGECEECKKKEYLQRRAAGAGGPATAPPMVGETIDSPGQPLDTPTRAFMEPRFGHDFGSVRVHADSRAAASASSIDALAYTAGDDVVFGAGQYAPQTPGGRKLIAHELAHVVQQRGMSTPQTQAKLEVGSANDPLEREADRTAKRVTSAPASGRSDTPAQGSASPAAAPAATGLIVEDEARDLGPGQMRKSEFLDALRTSACAAADAVLAEVGRSTKGCPFVERWIGHYRNRPSAHVESAVRKYAPEAARVGTAHEYIPLVVARITRGVRRWATTGELTEVPEELASEVGSGGILGAIGGAVSAIAGGIGKAVSGIGGLFFKAREGGPRTAGDPAGIQASLNRGTPLDAGVRSRMEGAFGHDFSRVRVHADANAAQLSNSLNARAFTIGRDVAFGAGEYSPGTFIGDALIAHELAHVVQQSDMDAQSRQTGSASSEYGALEQDADSSAVGAVASAWGGANRAFKGLAQYAMPRLRSGMRIQRCGGGGAKESKTPAGKEDLGPFAPEAPKTPEELAKAAQEEAASAERFRQNPDLYDENYIPDVTVKLKKEAYLYDFSVSYMNIEAVCGPFEIGTQGCVAPDSPTENVAPPQVDYRTQTLGNIEYNSPLAVHVTVPSMTFTMYVPPEKLKDGDTLNHELWHVVDDYLLVQTYKERLARAIRDKLMANRKEAAHNPEKRDSLIGQQAIVKIFQDAIAPFIESMKAAYQARSLALHKRANEQTLPPVQIPASWKAFRMPPIVENAKGSLVSASDEGSK
jgi:hypothetical protein